MTPTILLNSKSKYWPNGLANTSGYVGRNLMFHASDFIAIRERNKSRSTPSNKSLALNDWYISEEAKLGTMQSLGINLNWGQILGYLHQNSQQDPKYWKTFLKPLYRPISMIASAYFRNAAIFATIIEDLPYLENRITPNAQSKSGFLFHYNYTDELKQRTLLYRKKIQEKFGVLSVFNLSSENNINFGHACGTCRFGEDPSNSVLDKNNKAFGLKNLYVVDGSFFPSSGGTNPSLTIAANAIRVGEVIDKCL